MYFSCVSYFLLPCSHFRKPLNIFCEFIPQVLFLMSIFGYMNLLIIWKWFKYNAANSGCAPSVLITLINMFLNKYQDEPCNVAPYDGQQVIQTVLLLLALVCIPWMLVLKPVILKKQNDRKVALEAIRSPRTISIPNPVSGEPSNGRPASPNGDLSGEHEQLDAVEHQGQGDDGHGGEFDMGDIIIHQAIHTIEYCLGSVSHTASYLRLWALSLAHAQLSEVLWSMVMKNGLGFGSRGAIVGGIGMYLVFAFWATRSDPDGRSERLPPRTPSPLGGIPVQVLHGQRLSVRAAVVKTFFLFAVF